MGSCAQGAGMDPVSQWTKSGLAGILGGDLRLFRPLVHHEEGAAFHQIVCDAEQQSRRRKNGERESPSQHRSGGDEWKPGRNHLNLFFYVAIVGDHE